MKLGFVAALLAMTGIAMAQAKTREIVTEFPKRNPGLFTLEMFEISAAGAVFMLLAGFYRKSPATLSVALITFVVCGVLHILQQYSGVYSYSYDKPAPVLEKEWYYVMYACAGILGLLAVLLLLLTFFYNNENAEPLTIGHIIVAFFEALGFATAFSVPYIHVAYNRDKRITKEAVESTVATFASFFGIYAYLKYTGIFDSLFTRD